MRCSVKNLLVGVLAAGFLAQALPASAQAPVPVEAGEFYLGGSYGRYTMDSDWKALRLFTDDSAFNGGLVTVSDKSPGFLVKHKIRDRKYIPTIQIGYGFSGAVLGSTDPESVLRIELVGDYWKRSEESGFSGIQTPLTGFETQDGSGATVDTGAVVAVWRLDGREEEADGTGQSYLLTSSTLNSWLETKETVANAGFTMWFDTPHGNWRFSRGAGFRYQYNRSEYMHDFWTDGLVVLSVNDYDLAANNFHFPMMFSVGYEVLPFVTPYIFGSFAPGVMLGNVKAEQWIRLPDDVSNLNVNADYHFTKTLKRTMFAFDARAAAGISFRLWIIRFGAEVGGYYNTQFIRVAEVKKSEPANNYANGFRLSNSPIVGYFGSARAMIIF